LRILNLGGEEIDTRSATDRLILTIFAGFAQFVREIMLERQREGIRKAQAAGKYLGRKPSASLKASEAVVLVMGGEPAGLRDGSVFGADGGLVPARCFRHVRLSLNYYIYCFLAYLRLLTPYWHASL
jgi:hypothetical protein